MRTMTRFILFSALIAACHSQTNPMDASQPEDAGPDGGGDMADNLACTITATTSLEALTKVVTGSGELRCGTPATLWMRVCLYSKALSETVWRDLIECQDASGSGQTSLKRDITISVAVGPSRHYRTVVETQVGGVSQPSQTSATITAP
ncbi:MAG: hypothetical protein JNJ46_22350 [Myxococcales bacterium]|nr:hypothetical protein [Myxococcales bacterium]